MRPSDKNIFHLIYVSTAARSFDDRELDELLVQAREDNAVYGITGLLIHGGGKFMQLLEGGQAEVEMIYEKIKADSRHHDVQTCLTHLSRARWCGDWTMAFRRHNDGRHIEGMVNLLGGNENLLRGLDENHFVSMMMQGFAQHNA